VANNGDATVSVLAGNGNGTFQSQTTFTVGTGPIAMAVTDISGDGRPDILTANYNSNSVTVLANVAKGDFTGQIYTVSSPVPTHFALAAPSKGALNNKIPKLVLTRSCNFGDIFGYARCTSN